MVIKEEEKLNQEKKREYIYTIGKRKTAVARLKLFKAGKGTISINGLDYKKYFSTYPLQQIITDAIRSVGQVNKIDFEVKTSGGGKMGQAEAIRHAAAKALVVFNQNFKRNLRKVGYLTRDSRIVERKKYGLKKARRAPQWSKR